MEHDIINNAQSADSHQGTVDRGAVSSFMSLAHCLPQKAQDSSPVSRA
jgi:hypothetical protein